MGKIVGFKCVRCGQVYPPDLGAQLFEGCPACAQVDAPANLSTLYDYTAVTPSGLLKSLKARPRNMWRYLELLPAQSLEEVVTLEEGCTPMVRLRELEKRFGIGRLFVKEEYRNPTGSYKDRLAACALTHAVQAGANVVTVASTGNHGASTAAYASRAGKDCVIFTLASVPMTMKVMMQVYGAHLVACEKSEDRWRLMGWGVRNENWYPTGNFVAPPIGSNPYGVDGYKTIACEICEDLQWSVPDVVIQPTAYGDGLYGMWRGFKELKEIGLTVATPHMYAAEVFGPLKQALESASKTLKPVPVAPSAAFSIATPLGTYQALAALSESQGGAVAIPEDEELLAVQADLGKQGIYAEVSSCASVAAAIRLAQAGKVGPDETVVCVLTSTGLRDPWVTQKRLPEVPIVNDQPERLREVLKKTYGYSL